MWGWGQPRPSAPLPAGYLRAVPLRRGCFARTLLRAAALHKVTSDAMNHDKLAHARENAKGWLRSIEEMLSVVRAAAGGDYEEAQQAIHESVLSVLIREGWHELGKSPENGPEEYEILLSTGGPALRIWGKLNTYCEPETAEMQMQDWYTPWTRCHAPEAILLEFARQFYFGE
jgi:hypothetical protein